MRLAQFLQDHADRDGWLKITQADLAQILGVSRFAVGSHLQKLKARDLVELRYGGIRVTDWARLRVDGAQP